VRLSARPRIPHTAARRWCAAAGGRYKLTPEGLEMYLQRLRVLLAELLGVDDGPDLTWYIGLGMALLGGLGINMGANLMKLGHVRQQRQKQGTVVWAAGMTLFVCGNLSNFTAASFTPATTITAVSSVQLISNVVFASLVLGERLTWPVAMGTVVITLGDVLLVGSGTHHRCANDSVCVLAPGSSRQERQERRGPLSEETLVSSLQSFVQRIGAAAAVSGICVRRVCGVHGRRQHRCIRAVHAPVGAGGSRWTTCLRAVACGQTHTGSLRHPLG
jgi:hypothetical protein